MLGNMQYALNPRNMQNMQKYARTILLQIRAHFGVLGTPEALPISAYFMHIRPLLMILSQSRLFFLGGADTLESLLTFATYELALNVEVQEKPAQAVEPSMK